MRIVCLLAPNRNGCKLRPPFLILLPPKPIRQPHQRTPYHAPSPPARPPEPQLETPLNQLLLASACLPACLHRIIIDSLRLRASPTASTLPSPPCLPSTPAAASTNIHRHRYTHIHASRHVVSTRSPTVSRRGPRRRMEAQQPSPVVRAPALAPSCRRELSADRRLLGPSPATSCLSSTTSSGSTEASTCSIRTCTRSASPALPFRVAPR